jgi:maltooligosyltrehalose trehalohydrolase
VHHIYDQSAKHFIQELTERVGQLSRESARKYYLIGESDLNDIRFLKPPSDGGYGLDAQWCNDFHHSLHTLLTGDNSGHYEDFGQIEQMAKAFKEGFVYSWQFSRFRKKFHGSSSRQRPARQFVVFAQNHDQIGNRLRGERLSRLVDFESLKLAAGTLLLSPYVPLLFMGEEYAEEAPFLYFVSYTDPGLVAAVREGRKTEFEAFQGEQQCPDPQEAESFQDSSSNGTNATAIDMRDARVLQASSGAAAGVFPRGEQEGI